MRCEDLGALQVIAADAGPGHAPQRAGPEGFEGGGRHVALSTGPASGLGGAEGDEDTEQVVD